eukprot:11931133-Alexandrium_andersonii.AAC.1
MPFEALALGLATVLTGPPSEYVEGWVCGSPSQPDAAAPVAVSCSASLASACTAFDWLQSHRSSLSQRLTCTDRRATAL